MTNKNEISVELVLDGLEEQLSKVERYVELLKEAKTLADELASTEFDVAVKQD